MMTAEEAMLGEARRMLSCLMETDPASDSYGTLLTNLEHLLGIRAFVADTLDMDGPNTVEKPAQVVQLSLFDPAPDEPEPCADPGCPDPGAPAEQSAPSAPDEDMPSYTKEQVRAALGAARAKGANITALLKEFGVDSFPALPVGKYPDIMHRVKELA